MRENWVFRQNHGEISQARKYLSCPLCQGISLENLRAFPPLGWRWLIVVGLGGLLAALHGQQGTKARALGLLHGVVAYGVGLVWMWRIFGVASPLLWVILATFTVAFAHFQGRAVAHGLNGWKLALFSAANWCGFEFLRSEIYPLKFPWMTSGLALGPNTILRRWKSWRIQRSSDDTTRQDGDAGMF
jgi:apolipoprotein N-acyltransferase